MFYLPGGKREKGESDWEALPREVQEELNVSLIADTLTEVLVVQEVAHGYTEPLGWQCAALGQTAGVK
ncbi:NUDIX domain-containing protein [Trichocoleus desertorum GB2-A4]|uniref:NUDIX domain-containing protein n=1 Tax=Trichocoleus desertorum GB2-A4 TaxID=2933944 RepID=A0ABV0JGA5_9CYAN